MLFESNLVLRKIYISIQKYLSIIYRMKKKMEWCLYVTIKLENWLSDFENSFRVTFLKNFNVFVCMKNSE